MTSMSKFVSLAAIVFLVVSGIAYAANPGAIAIFEESTGGDMITTSTFTHTFGNTVRADPGYTLSGTDSVALDAGRYLVLYNSQFDSTSGGNRSEMQSHLNLAGTDLPIGWSQSYIRRTQGQDSAITSGAGIINVASDGDALQFRTFRTDNNGAGVARSGTGLQLLKLDDSWDYLSLSRSTETSNIGTSPGAVTYDNVTEVGSAFSFTGDPEDITLNEDGKYLVVANTFFNTDGSNTRTTVNQQLSLGDGTTQTAIDGTQTSVYIRGLNSTQDGAAAITSIVDATAGDVLNVEFDVDGHGGTDIVADRTAITIAKLPDSAQIIRAGEDPTGQNVNDSNAVTWTNTQLDAAFSHTNPATAPVTVNEDGDYLFLASLFTDDTNSARAFPELEFEVDGDTFTYGRTGFYTRNTGGGQSGGNFGGILLDLMGNDNVQLVTSPLGNTGNVPLDNGGLQGVFLPSLFTPVPEPASIAIWSLIGVALAGFGVYRRRRKK